MFLLKQFRKSRALKYVLVPVYIHRCLCKLKIYQNGNDSNDCFPEFFKVNLTTYIYIYIYSHIYSKGYYCHLGS